MRTIGLLFLFAVLGCSHQVVVVDQAGRPVEGANVAPISPSFNGAPVKTDSSGIADIPTHVSLQNAYEVSISKPGFDQVSVSMPEEWPLRITIAPAGTAKSGFQHTAQP